MVKLTRLAALLVALLSSTASATPPDTYGFGNRSTALGGAVSADVQDGSSNYHNPAGLAMSDGIHIDIDYMSATPNLRINDERSSVERFGALQLGLVVPVEIEGVTFAFGLGLVLPDQRLARTRSTIVERPRWELFDTRSHRVFLASHLAFSPVDWLSIGAGIAFQAPSELTLDIRGALSLTDPEGDSRLEHQFKGDLTSIRYVQAGIQIRPHERFSIGLTYRGEYTLANRIIATADVRVASIADLLFSLDTFSTSLFGPQQVSLGFAFSPCDCLRVGLEVTWYDWSAHPSLIPTEQILLELDPAIVELPSEIGGRSAIPMDMHDTFVPRIGIEWHAIDTDAIEFDVRAGYVYENSPFPVQRGVGNFVDGDRHTTTLGFGLKLTDLRPTLPGHLGFEAYFLYTHVVPRTHVKDSLVDSVGDYTADGRIMGVGVGVEIGFE